jgi:hypothetical protein
MGKLFISHAVADKGLIDQFVDFLQTACGVKQDDIFCSSLEGMNISEGSNFYDVIHEALKGSEFVVMVITPAYYESVFCLCELGATWIMQRDCFPLIVPPLTFADLKAVLHPMQSGIINNRENLANLFDRLKAVRLASGTTARFGLKCDAFIKKFEGLKLKGRTRVSAEEYEDLKTRYEEALEDNLASEKEIERLKRAFDELAKKKDASDVISVKLAGSPEPQQFESLCQQFREVAGELPSAALEAVYQENRGGEYVLPTYYGNEHKYEDAQQAGERQFVRLDDNVVSLVESHPKVRDVLDHLRTLSRFVACASDPFKEKYESVEKHPFSLSNRDFWEKNLGL